MANYNLTQTGDEVQAYIDSIPVIDVTGTLSGSNIVFATNPYTQIAANYAADCGSVVRLTVGTKIYIVRISGYDGTNFTGSVKDGDDFVSLSIGSSAASGIINSPSFSTGEALSGVGIDATPTQGSDNLVKSGGIVSFIAENIGVREFTMTGNGNTLVSSGRFAVSPNRKYKIELDGYDNSSVTSADTYYAFSVFVNPQQTGGTSTHVLRIYNTAETVLSWYVVTTLSDSHYMGIDLRSNSGTNVKIKITDVTDEYNDMLANISEKLAKGEAVSLSNEECRFFLYKNNTQYNLNVGGGVAGKDLTDIPTVTTSKISRVFKFPVTNVGEIQFRTFSSSVLYGNLFITDDDKCVIGVVRRLQTSSSYTTDVAFLTPQSAAYYLNVTSFESVQCTLYPRNVSTLDALEEQVNVTAKETRLLDLKTFCFNFGEGINTSLSDFAVGQSIFTYINGHNSYESGTFYAYMVDIAEFKKISFAGFKTSSNYGHLFLDANGIITGYAVNKTTSYPDAVTFDVPNGSKWLLYLFAYTVGTDILFSLSKNSITNQIANLEIAIAQSEASATEFLSCSQGKVLSSGLSDGSAKYVTTTPIWGGRGFAMSVNDACKINSVHLFNADGSVAFYNYIAPDSGRTGITIDGTRYGTLAILPQFYARIVIEKADGSDIAATEKIISSFVYLDKGIFSRIESQLPVGRAFRRISQLNNMVWEALADVPIYSSTASQYYFKKGNVVSGVPYSDVAEYDKYVGNHVSVRTFLTAAKNKRSLLYTEKCAQGVSQYGLSYHNNLAWSYFGSVCSAFTAYVANFAALYLSTQYHINGISGMTTIADATFDTIEPLDFMWNEGHIAIIADIILDEYGERQFAVIAEQTVPHSKITPYTREDFELRMERPCEIHRYSGWNSLAEPDALPYIQEKMWDYPRPLDYEPDICTFAGNYACFATGDAMYLNLNRTKGYTTLEIYLNDALMQSVNITNTTTYPSDGLYPEDGEDWVKFNLASYNLGAGKYKARLTGSNIASGYTYWEVVDVNISATSTSSSVTATFSSSNGTPYLIQSEKLDGFPRYYALLSSADVTAGTKTMAWGADSNYTYIKLFVRGDYGVAVKRVQL